MVISSTVTSGCSVLEAWIASWAFLASPHITHCGRDLLIRVLTPSRTTSWSSTIKIFGGIHVPTFLELTLDELRSRFAFMANRNNCVHQSSALSCNDLQLSL